MLDPATYDDSPLFLLLPHPFSSFHVPSSSLPPFTPANPLFSFSFPQAHNALPSLSSFLLDSIAPLDLFRTPFIASPTVLSTPFLITLTSNRFFPYFFPALHILNFFLPLSPSLITCSSFLLHFCSFRALLYFIRIFSFCIFRASSCTILTLFSFLYSRCHSFLRLSSYLFVLFSFVFCFTLFSTPPPLSFLRIFRKSHLFLFVFSPTHFSVPHFVSESFFSNPPPRSPSSSSICPSPIHVQLARHSNRNITSATLRQSPSPANLHLVTMVTLSTSRVERIHTLG